MSITTLEPPSSKSIAIQIKLNNDIIQKLKTSPAKLIVRDGNYFLKVAEEYPCVRLPENSNVDIYSGSSYQGRVSTKLTVVSDSRRMNQIKTATPLTPTPRTPTPLSPSIRSPKPAPAVQTPLKSISAVYEGSNNPFKIGANDPREVVTKKFVYLLSLGPISYQAICRLMDFAEIGDLLEEHAEGYQAQNCPDMFPYRDEGNFLYILKDKTYKQLIPIDWDYKENEQPLVVDNINSALSRLGYSKTHPVRKKILSPTRPKKEAPPPPQPSQTPAADEVKSKPRSGNDNKYYQELALSFKSKYQEYSLLYAQLKSHNSDKDKLIKLVELHNLLREWKGKLWDYDRKLKEIKRRKVIHY
ncbi:uncharacterized protein LODBEIA_P29720 [Lodderomyces beijingensis]|uniref:Uncharacterized protein n=1 Tax=Lodderomyces beijingensis TaxID=1775926 RepID=A0ABP0ZM73_9ASCO